MGGEGDKSCGQHEVEVAVDEAFGDAVPAWGVAHEGVVEEFGSPAVAHEVEQGQEFDCGGRSENRR
ncbi:hypothetical protein NY043_08700 [Corynebacterium diphtheriae bv. gravis]|nr:hypothetical protein NY043_08700 [Corynebacterium diphtheriae bv. gravis]